MLDQVYTIMEPSKKQPVLEELQSIEGVEFHSIKHSEPETDAYRFLYGVIVAKHQGVLYSCWASNKGEENTDTEVVCGSFSLDNGKNWSESEVWLEGKAHEGISHGAFLSAKGSLWGFFPHFTGTREHVKVYLYQLQQNCKWKKICQITELPFWPLGEPQKMANGSYIMPGVLAMTDSKPCTGILSSGKCYSIGTTVADNGYSRYPLTIALGTPGVKMFQEIKSIRSYNSAIDRPLNEGEKMLLAYPYATEADGKLYITYSVGIVEKAIHNYNNHAEIAIVDINKL